jgi:phage tail sheath protein FI
MPKHHTPGVYFESLDRRSSVLPPLARTDVAGFVGITRRGPVGIPVRVESWNQFTSTFGGHAPVGLLSWAIEGFFSNGGRRCWVVRAAASSATPGRWVLPTTSGTSGMTLVAASPGSWAREATVSVSQVTDRLFSLNLRLPDGSEEVWRNVSAQPPFFDLVDKSGKPSLRLTLRDPALWVTPSAVALRSPGTFQVLGSGLTITIKTDAHSVSGFSVYPVGAVSVDPVPGNSPAGSSDVEALRLINDQGVFQSDPRFAGTLLNDPVKGSRLAMVTSIDGLPFAAAPPVYLDGTDGLADLGMAEFEAGLDKLAVLDQIAVLAMPDLVASPVEEPAPPPTVHVPCSVLTVDKPADTPPPFERPKVFDSDQISHVQNAMVLQCERLRDRVAILDPPLPEMVPNEAIQWRQGFTSAFAACYYPWLVVPDPLQLNGLVRTLPPAGHVAGIYARVETVTGVHKPPANEVLEGVEDLTVGAGDVVHGLLNDAQVNLIRAYPGRRIRVAGARTTSDTDALRFVNVRRLLIAIERSIRINLQWIVFEPSNPILWLQVDRVIRAFLESLWQRGFLDGEAREQAYSVRCDETTNPRFETDSGRLTCEIGLLPPWPAEFVVFRIGITEGEVEMRMPAEAQVA